MPESEAIRRVHEATAVWNAGYVPEDFPQLRLDLQHILDCLPAEETCCVCGSPGIVYRNYLELPFCVLCVDGNQPGLCPHTLARHEGEPIGVHCQLPHGHQGIHQYPDTAQKRYSNFEEMAQDAQPLHNPIPRL